MKHKKIINIIYNHIKSIKNFDYKNMITDPSQCLHDNKDFDEFFDSDNGDYLDCNIDLETFNDLARFAILKKLQRDLKCISIKLELKIIKKNK